MHCTNPGPAPADITAKLSAVLAYAYEKNVESFFEPCLEIAYRLLHATAQAAKVPLFWPASCLEVLEPPEPFSRHCHDLKCSTLAPPPQSGPPLSQENATGEEYRMHHRQNSVLARHLSLFVLLATSPDLGV